MIYMPLTRTEMHLGSLHTHLIVISYFGNIQVKRLISRIN